MSRAPTDAVITPPGKRTIHVKLPYLHPGQQRVFEALKRKRFIIVCFGRRAGKSFPEGEEVVTADGALRWVEELKGKSMVIPSFDDELNMVSAEAFFDPLPPQKIIQVTTSLGSIIRRTEDHPILTPSGFVPIKDLKVGQEIIWSPIPLSGEEMDVGEDEWWEETFWREKLHRLHPEGLRRFITESLLMDPIYHEIELPDHEMARRLHRALLMAGVPCRLEGQAIKDVDGHLAEFCEEGKRLPPGPITDEIVDVKDLGVMNAVGVSVPSTHHLATPYLEHNTVGGVIIMLWWALNWSNQMIWWVAPTRGIAKISWRLFCRMCPDRLIKEINRQDLMIELINGSTIFWKSGDRPYTLLGEGINLCIIDEAAEVKEDVWKEIIRPALSDKEGSAIIMSRPHGANWFYEEYLKGLPDEEGRTKDPEYISLRLESRENPFFPAEEWEKAKRQLPRAVFDQEYRAVFAAGASAVFSTVDECLVQEVVPARGRKFMGVDPGRKRDYAAIVILDMHRQVVFARMWRGLPFTTLKSKIERLAQDWNAEVWIDTHVLGSGLEDFLLASPIAPRIRSMPVKSSQVRRDLIEELAVAMDPALTQPHITIPAGPNLDFNMPDGDYYHELYRELRDMDYKVTSSGEIKYQPGIGGHDDMVIALALANWGLKDRIGRVYSIKDLAKPMTRPSLEVRRATRVSRKYSLARMGRKTWTRQLL